jgi:major type 1 subunit fimbrin (pilin)
MISRDSAAEVDARMNILKCIVGEIKLRSNRSTCLIIHARSQVGKWIDVFCGCLAHLVPSSMDGKIVQITSLFMPLNQDALSIDEVKQRCSNLSTVWSIFMKNSVLSALVATVFGLAAASAHAAAGDGTITFNGALTATTCTINGNGTSAKDFSVTLPTVSTNTLKTAGDTAGSTGFNIALTGCTPVTATSQASVFYEAGATTDLADNGLLLVDAGGAQNVKLQLRNQDGSTIKAGFSRELQGSKPASLASGAATLYYMVQYYAKGATTAGAANSSVVYSIDYQ